MLSILLPRGFFCAGCSFTTWKTVCDACRASLPRNRDYLDSPITEIEALCPLIYSYSRSQLLIRRYKEYGGSDLQRMLFQIHPKLLHQLMETHFFAVVPIPQDPNRSYIRGHESALEVAKFFSRQLQIPVVPLLRLNQMNPKRLTGLSKFAREWSENPFSIRTDAISGSLYSLFDEKVSRGKEIRILLVDDLITSGSTIAKAGHTLKAYYPKLKIWGGSIGFRPHHRIRQNLVKR